MIKAQKIFSDSFVAKKSYNTEGNVRQINKTDSMMSTFTFVN